MNKKKELLMVAYACEPNETSEPGVGWNFSQRIADFMNITLITRSNNQVTIESVPNEAGIEYLYYDLPEYLTKLKKKIPFGLQLYYMLWQLGAYREAKRMTQKKRYDLFHHLTFGMTKMVPPIFQIKIPSVWGPIGGGDIIPYHFLNGAGVKPYISEFIYRTLHQLSNYSIFAYFTRKKVNAIIFRNSSILENFPKNGCQRRYVFSETASISIPKSLVDKKVKGSLRILCIGRMIQSKGYIFALEGFKNFLDAGGEGKLIFLGRGPEESRLKAYVAKNQLEKFVEFQGFVGHDVVEQELSDAHLLLHPSFREGGSWSIMEAMTNGLPVICLDTSGPKDMVTHECGVMVPMETPDQVVEGIAKGLALLLSDAELYQRFSSNAQKRMQEEYTWEKRVMQIKDVYQEVLNEKI